ncbi:RagB/SusD family nutrient uptake outer membrane protein [Prolixibacteraceae bacterium]|nr:RagB/SusD family nutrient uptake outer membrane protein [Prolixibacteraceae bacterium]
MKRLIYTISLLSLLASCSESFLDVDPHGVVAENQLDNLAQSNPSNLTMITSPKIKGAYARFHDYSPGDPLNHDESGLQTIKLVNDLMGEDIAFVTLHHYQFDYRLVNNQSTYRRTKFIWKLFYTTIKDANDIIKVLAPVENKTEVVTIDLAQGYFLRAFSYFNLIRHYQHRLQGHEDDLSIPLVTEMTSGSQPKAKTQVIYDQIISDIENAMKLMDGMKLEDKTMATYNTINGLAARVYLTMEQWDKAAAAAKAARGTIAPMGEKDLLETGFSSIVPSAVLWGFKDTKETSMGILSFNSHMARFEHGYAKAVHAYKRIDTRLQALIPATDTRSKWFTQDGDVFKEIKCGKGDQKKFYNIDAESNVADNVHMRVGEMFLIEAEAEARSGNFAKAQSVLNELVSTRDKTFKTTLSGEALIDQILLQRRIELWGEGFRLMDLQRLNKGYTRDYKGTNHNSTVLLTVPAASPLFLHAIPRNEMDTNDKM